MIIKKTLIILIALSTGFVSAQNIVGTSTQSTATERNNARLIVEDNNGDLHVAYYDNGIYYSFSDDAGANWSTALLIDETGRNPSLAVDNDNVLHLVYKYGGTNAYDIVHRTYNEEIWSEFDVVYHDEVTEISRPVIAVDSENSLHCVWQRSGYTAVPNSEIWYSKFTSGTGWETPVNISNSYGASEYPTLTIDNNNNIYVFWKDSGEDIGNDKMVLYRKYIVGIGWDADYTNISNTTGNGSYATMDPCAVTDTDGNIHLVWKDSETGNREIFYKKCTNGVWDIDYTNISNTAEASAHPSISTDNQGNLHVFWAEKIGGIYYEIVYIKYDKILETWSETTNISNTGNVESEHPNAPDNISNSLSVIWTEGDASPFSVMYYGEMLPVSIEEFDKKLFSINIFPNPFTDKISINYNIKNERKTKVTIVLSNSFGKIGKIVTRNHNTVGDFTVTLATDNLNEGIYFLRTEIDGIVHTEKALLIR